MEDDARQEWDFKFGPMTLMVAPGTVTDKGRYTPLIRWQEPPILDPRILAPQIELFKDQRPFLIDNRSKKSRIVAAQKFLRLHARVSESKKNGHQALIDVAVMLVVYYDLDPELAFYIMTHEGPGFSSWNERCIDEAGKSYPWSAKELWAALNNAQDAAPALGIKEYQAALKNDEIRWLMASFIEILRSIPTHTGKPAMTAMDLFNAFQMMYGLNLVKGMASVLGTEIRLAILDKSLLLEFTERKGSVYYLGVSPALLEAAKDRYKARQRLFALAQ